MLVSSSLFRVFAQDALDELLDTPNAVPGIDQILAEKKAPDFEGLRHSFLATVAQAQSSSNLILISIQVPTNGEYRISLRQQVSLRVERPVTMTLRRQSAESGSIASGAPVAGSHEFGKIRLAPTIAAGVQETQKPVRFEGAAQRVGVPSDPVILWEHWDTVLQAGVYELALNFLNPKARVSAVFISRSKDFRPSLSAFPDDNTLNHLYVRYRLLETQPAAGKFSIQANLTYHWSGRASKTGDSLWGFSGGGVNGVPPGQWSSFVDVTQAVLPGPGPWSTWRVTAPGLRRGRLGVQFAWSPHEAAVVSEFETGLGVDGALFRFPNGQGALAAGKTRPVWGVWNPSHFALVMPQEAIIDRYLEWGRETELKFGIKDGAARPHRLRFYTGCRVNEDHRERVVAMLARLGINWIDGAPASVIAKYGLHDTTSIFNSYDPEGSAARMTPAQRQKVEKIKIGDEINTSAKPETINSDPARLAKFHAYLREQMESGQSNPRDYYGVADLAELSCMATLPDNSSRFERRLFYHSQRFRHLITADIYRDLIRRFESFFPNARIYNNYTPHPVFLTGSTMNEADWFVLCRNKAQSLGWAEDWATTGSWGLGTAYQCTSFYAALVECAVRRHGQPSGFYIGVNCGGAAQKVFSCVARGLTWLHLYDWGPFDIWADGSNAWSEHRGQYESVMVALRALGPADVIIAEGRREPRQVAILYNRSHEIWQGGTGRFNHDWMWTYLGLAAAHIPADVIIEEDLNADDLQRYRVIYLGGFNLSARHVSALRKWVENGGLLIGSGGAASRDLDQDPLPATIDLFGAEQRPADARESSIMTNVLFAASEWFPCEMDLKPRGMLHSLKPVGAGQSIARYSGGDCAAVINTIGTGRTLLFGFQPGITYQQNGAAQGKGRTWLAAPLIKTLGRPRADLDFPGAEVTLFEHPSGLAVMLAAFGSTLPEGGCTLSVQAGRKISEVVSSLHGPVTWELKGDRIEIKIRQLSPVDVIILRDAN